MYIYIYIYIYTYIYYVLERARRPGPRGEGRGRLRGPPWPPQRVYMYIYIYIYIYIHSMYVYIHVQLVRVKIRQRGVQWKQGVVMRMLLCTSLLYNTTPIHCTPLPLHPPLMNTQASPRTMGQAQKGHSAEVTFVFVSFETYRGP